MQQQPKPDLFYKFTALATMAFILLALIYKPARSEELCYTEAQVIEVIKSTQLSVPGDVGTAQNSIIAYIESLPEFRPSKTVKDKSKIVETWVFKPKLPSGNALIIPFEMRDGKKVTCVYYYAAQKLLKGFTPDGI